MLGVPSTSRKDLFQHRLCAESFYGLALTRPPYAHQAEENMCCTVSSAVKPLVRVGSMKASGCGFGQGGASFGMPYRRYGSSSPSAQAYLAKGVVSWMLRA